MIFLTYENTFSLLFLRLWILFLWKIILSKYCIASWQLKLIFRHKISMKIYIFFCAHHNDLVLFVLFVFSLFFFLNVFCLCGNCYDSRYYLFFYLPPQKIHFYYHFTTFCNCVSGLSPIRLFDDCLLSKNIVFRILSTTTMQNIFVLFIVLRTSHCFWTVVSHLLFCLLANNAWMTIWFEKNIIEKKGGLFLFISMQLAILLLTFSLTRNDLRWIRTIVTVYAM